MTEALPDTWFSRELPVLKAVVEGLERAQMGEGVRVPDIADASGLDTEQVLRSLQALEEDAWVELRLMNPAIVAGRAVRASGKARVAVGTWPSPETALDRMIAVLEQIAANTNDEDTRTRAQRVRDLLGHGAGSLGLALGAAALGGQFT